MRKLILINIVSMVGMTLGAWLGYLLQDKFMLLPVVFLFVIWTMTYIAYEIDEYKNNKQ